MKKLILIVLALALSFASCKKKSTAEDTGDYPGPETKLAKVTGTTDYGDGAGPKDIGAVFSYTEGYNELFKIKQGKKTINIGTITGLYPRLAEVLDSTNATVTRSVIEPSAVTGPYLLLQASELLYEGDQLVSTINKKYINDQTYITEVQHLSGNTSGVVEKYTYVKGNIATYDNGRGLVYSYKYDNKKNPYYNRACTSVLGLYDFTSANCPVEMVIDNGSAKKTTNLHYTYNAEGFPLTVVSTGHILMNCKFEYVSLPIIWY